MFSSNSTPDSPPHTFDVYALSSLIKDQFKKPTRGDAILVYNDGQTRYVHRYDCVTYHIVDGNTSSARCIITCLVYTSLDSTDRSKCQLSYYMRDLQGNLTIPQFHEVIIKDVMVLGQGDMYELLMSHRVHDHLVHFGPS
ncbi:hypothetical protein DFH28DRAFT_1102938 [Melampsora americana]|nr:hypothetical protein DFH28DRAFT_1109211 [Melampsora americana]KAH9823942.1 hypothetical protein DFH28DRAFT_1102938 [Melampsora americana]